MTDADDLDAIVAALGRLRGRPPFGRGRFGDGPPEPGAEGAPPFGPGRHPRRGPAPWGMAEEHREHLRGAMRGGFAGGPARFRLLEALAAASGPLSVSEVGEAIGVDQPRASRLIQQAVQMGLVEREADPDDARRTRIALTAQGRQLARGFRGDRRERLGEALSSFSPEERRELARLLAKLADSWPDA